jgi:lysozyme family protein
MRFFVLVPAVVALLSACSPANFVSGRVIRGQKSKACIKAASITGSYSTVDQELTWEPQYKTFTDLDRIVIDVGSFFNFGLSADTEAKYRDNYTQLWNTIELKQERIAALESHLARVLQGLPKYKEAGASAGIPWWWIGIIHGLEGGYNFGTHLHNGDPLKARTVHVPAGRPKTGEPPFTWTQSASDALGAEESLKSNSWSSPAYIAYTLESYNGYGYRSKGINSPYLWSFSNQYSKGKYIGDGVYSSSAISAQAGGMAILKHAINKGIVNLDRVFDVPSSANQQQYQDKIKTLPPLVQPSDDCAT